MSRWIGHLLPLAVVMATFGGCFSDAPLIIGDADTVLPDVIGEEVDGAAVPPDKPAQPNACETSADCTGSQCRSGVCVVDPPGSSVGVVTNTDNVATEQAPNLACVEVAPATPAGPATVTMFGAVARFGNGNKTIDIQVDVFDATTFDPSICESRATLEDRLQCYQDYGADGLGVAPLGTALSEPVVRAPAELPASCQSGTTDEGDSSLCPIGYLCTKTAPPDETWACTPPELPESCQKPLGDEGDHSLCPLGYRCIEVGLDWHCLEQYGVYEVAGIPTNTPLVLRSRATTFTNKWHDSYTFNVYLYADQAEAGDRMHYDATMVSEGQWRLTPNTVSLPPIGEGNGVIGGRVRDCRSDRDSWPISQVALGLANPAAKIVFFNNLEDDTVPLPDRDATNILGRFAALDVPAGWNAMSGSVRIGSDVFTLGAVDVYVFPDSLSLVTFPGLQPHWSQALAQ